MIRIALMICLASASAQAAEWVRGGEDGTQPRWGVVGGLQFSLHPATRGPRGLIRLFSPTLPDGKYDLINFIAVEPVIAGRRGLSELERSTLDQADGKRFWVEPGEMQGTLEKRGDGVEALRVVIHVERFENGADVKLVAEQRSDRPDEIALTVVANETSAEMEQCILTATMGNKARARVLWLKDQAIRSPTLYANYRGPDFAPATTFGVDKIATNADGDLIAAITTDEDRPADVKPFAPTTRWYYGGEKVTQYWRKPRGSWSDDIQVAVNARYMYWRSRKEIPGGISFENFELREQFRPGQQFIFGITRKTPEQLGISTRE